MSEFIDDDIPDEDLMAFCAGRFLTAFGHFVCCKGTKYEHLVITLQAKFKDFDSEDLTEEQIGALVKLICGLQGVNPVRFLAVFNTFAARYVS